MIPELEILVDDLKDYLKAKETALQNTPGFNAYTYGNILNKERTIENFKFYCEHHDSDPADKETLIKNLKEAAGKIKTEIDKISC